MVTSAFRRGVLSPPWGKWKNFPFVIESPVPFGVGCYHPVGTGSKTKFGSPCHQCLSAWGAITPMFQTWMLSKHAPVTSAFRRGVLSPQKARTALDWEVDVTSAFRRGVLSPRLLCYQKMQSAGMQVTSAFRRGVLSPPWSNSPEQLTTPRVSPVPFGVGCYHPSLDIEASNLFKFLGHQCLSAWGAITPLGVSYETVYVITSPVPFGVGCYHPSTLLTHCHSTVQHFPRSRALFSLACHLLFWHRKPSQHL